jgi:hypothetical protein
MSASQSPAKCRALAAPQNSPTFPIWRAIPSLRRHSSRYSLTISSPTLAMTSSNHVRPRPTASRALLQTVIFRTVLYVQYTHSLHLLHFLPIAEFVPKYRGEGVAGHRVPNRNQ